VSRMSRLVVNCLAAAAAGGCFLIAGGPARAAGPIAWAAPFTIDHAAINAGIGPLSCPSASLCVAIASEHLVSSTRPAAGASAWKDIAVSNAGAAVDMLDVSCPSTALCVAIDHAGDVVTSTDPGAASPTWTVSHVDSNTVGAYTADSLLAVDCPTTSLCVATDAVGDVVTSTDPAGGPTAWTVSHIDNNASYECAKEGACDPPEIWAISCASATSCVALDDDGGVLSSSDPVGGPGAWRGGNDGGGGLPPSESLAVLACPSTSLCVAAQDYLNEVFAATSPTNFPVVGVPLGDADSASGGVWCASASLCFYAAATASGVERVDLYVATNPTGPDSAWRLSDSRVNGIDSVSCPTIKLCFAGDGGEGAGGVLVGRPAPTADQIRTSIRRQLTPRGADSRIGSVRRHHGYRDTVRAPEAGELEISWYPPVTMGRAPHRHTVAKLIAEGAAQFDAQRTESVPINLNAAGRQLLKAKSRVLLTTRGRFTPIGGSVVATTATATLRR
jgi:hypothetical protein